MSQLFDSGFSNLTEKEARRASSVSSEYVRWKGQNPAKSAEQFMLYAKNNRQFWKKTIWYVTRRLTDPFIIESSRRFTPFINSSYARGFPGVVKTRQFLEGFPQNGSLKILTLNYDLLIEYALGLKGFNYGTPNEQLGFHPYPYPKPAHASGLITVLKLHGSISWSDTKKSPDGRYGLTGTGLIVPPEPEKVPHPALKTFWDMASTALRHSDTVIAFGCAFNTYDTAFIELVRTSIRPDCSFSLIDIYDRSGELVRMFKLKGASFVDASQHASANTLLGALFQKSK